MIRTWYDRHALPRLIDFACGMGDVMKQRSLLVPRARGRVLEIGMGTGLNLSFYDPAKVSTIVGVDPAAQMQKLAGSRAEAIQIPVEMVALELGQIRATQAASTASSARSPCAASPMRWPHCGRCAGFSSPAASSSSANMAWRRMPVSAPGSTG